MTDFMLLFRQPPAETPRSEAHMTEHLKKWDQWIGNIAAQGRMRGGQRLDEAPQQGKVLKASGIVSDGPFVEIKEILGGFIIVAAESLDEAVTLSHGCPILDHNGSVEVRIVLKN